MDWTPPSRRSEAQYVLNYLGIPLSFDLIYFFSFTVRWASGFISVALERISIDTTTRFGNELLRSTTNYVVAKHSLDYKILARF